MFSPLHEHTPLLIVIRCCVEIRLCMSRAYSVTPSLTLKMLVATIDAQWEGMGDVGSARYEPALLPPCPTIRVLSYSN